MKQSDFILPEWPVPSHVRALTTTRRPGVGKPPFDALNLAGHVGDDPGAVSRNRTILGQALAWPAEPLWLQQVHGTKLVAAGHASAGAEADGCYASSGGHVCAVLTADCLPILMCDEDGTEVAALHAGWRGLAGGIIGVAMEWFSAPPEKILAWLGPAIGPRKFEVGRDVYDAFVAVDNEARKGFQASGDEHWLADLYFLARLQFRRHGVNRVFGGDYCTYSDKDRFYSFRRDGITGRMASLIWIEK